MRFLLRWLLLLIPALASAQITTYYAIPPTLGCNGVWAIDAFSMNCGSAPYTYSTDPMGCAEWYNMTSDADTVFIPLCAMPCSLIITNSDGIECFGDTDTPTGIGAVATPGDLDITTANGNLEITSPQVLASARLRIMDLVGRTLVDQQLGDGDHWVIPMAQDVIGAYLVEIDAHGSRHLARVMLGAR